MKFVNDALEMFLEYIVLTNMPVIVEFVCDCLTVKIHVFVIFMLHGPQPYPGVQICERV